MKFVQICVTPLILLTVFSQESKADFFGLFGSYEDCVLESVKEAKTKSAALMARHACKKKYSEDREKDIQIIPHGALAELEGSARDHPKYNGKNWMKDLGGLDLHTTK
jgi:hypothetical protein